VASVYLLILIGLVAVPLAMTIKKPACIFEYPFFMAFAFAVFIVPQAFSLIRFPGFVEQSSVDAVLLMACLCLIASFLGYQMAPSAFMLHWASRPVNMQRLLRAGLCFIVFAYLMLVLLSGMNIEYSEAGGMTATATIVLFFWQLAYPGFAICLFCALRRPTLGTVVASIVGAYPPIQAVINGRRENAAMLALIIAGAFFYERRKAPPGVAIVVATIFAMLAIPATGEYRGYASDNDWNSIRQMDLVGSFERFLNEESVLELRNGAAIIESTRQTGNYQFGKAYWNHLVFRFVPAQLLGDDVKQALMFNVFDVAKAGGSETGIEFSRGSTITGMGDTFEQFGWLGCVFFAIMGVLFKGIWQASLEKDALFARVLYVLSITSGMRAVTHWTMDFLPGLIYFAVFLGIARFYAGAPVRQSQVARYPIALSDASS
jgi:hypothetical protein